MHLVNKAAEIAMETCETQTSTPGQQSHRSRSETRKRRRKMNTLAHLKIAYGNITEEATTRDVTTQVELAEGPMDNSASQAWHAELERTENADAPEHHDTTPKATLARAIRSTKQSIRTLDNETKQRRTQAATRKARRLIDTRPKLAHRRIFQKDDKTNNYLALQHPENKQLTDNPKGMVDIVTEHFSELNAPPRVLKQHNTTQTPQKPTQTPTPGSSRAPKTTLSWKPQPPLSPAGRGSTTASWTEQRLTVTYTVPRKRQIPRPRWHRQ